jgi:hypothetical protein
MFVQLAGRDTLNLRAVVSRIERETTPWYSRPFSVEL